MKCQKCGDDAPTRQVVLSQNIGLFFVRFPSRVEGQLCKRCIHRFFWKMTLTSLVLGWWGIISFFANIFIILGNIGTYVQCLGMPAGGRSPEGRNGRVYLSPAVNFSTERIERYKDEIVRLLAAGEPVAMVCEKIARLASAPESDIREYINEHIQPATAS